MTVGVVVDPAVAAAPAAVEPEPETGVVQQLLQELELAQISDLADDASGTPASTPPKSWRPERGQAHERARWVLRAHADCPRPPRPCADAEKLGFSFKLWGMNYAFRADSVDNQRKWVHALRQEMAAAGAHSFPGLCFASASPAWWTGLPLPGLGRRHGVTHARDISQRHCKTTP